MEELENELRKEKLENSSMKVLKVVWEKTTRNLGAEHALAF